MGEQKTEFGAKRGLIGIKNEAKKQFRNTSLFLTSADFRIPHLMGMVSNDLAKVI